MAPLHGSCALLNAASLADPGLRLADEGDAAGNLQLPAAVDQGQLGLVHLALVGLEDGAAGILAAAVGLHSADDLHAGDRLALAVVTALVAGRVGAAGVDQFDDPAAEAAVGGLGALDVGLGLASLAVDGLPAADDRIGGRVGRRGQGLTRQGDAGQQGLAHFLLPDAEGLPDAAVLASCASSRPRAAGRSRTLRGAAGGRPSGADSCTVARSTNIEPVAR